ncbi:MAG: T9SS type A sorting domain-containing protein, partial [Bacteroidia bacterium]|nr:T9SS type A sorting domain-containing protein [Bacteroidia bacterium]
GGNLEANSAGSGVGPSLRWASILPVGNHTVYLVATSIGLFATDTLTALTTVWTQQATNTIGSVVCDYIVSRASDGLVAIGTHGNGVYSANITDINQLVTGVKFSASANDNTFKNYPNPFSQNTSLEFNLKQKSTVKLVLLDETGKELRTLLNTTMDAGTYREELSRKGLPSGIYYCLLQFNNSKITRMLVIE